ncbi:SidA/IucD/PvdA family monooxygenase [Allosaccharopolyspora coralli]|uniref:SidA/IucD/PvdA family monooxygenase n=1 Tax=Allosaccharopolyspora coralli TaxID=2665642 RepID=A0A5Q3QJX5_9PSEU|nr:NAD(P)-binding domain-containing protein [Allosaccharopolyspora coralli]QGK71127.1 SidA/IucD/PvdA family monooxygenase [Allosaccharopolyspora coralli]
MVDALVVGGGQAGLAAAFELRRQGFRPTVLHAGAEPVGSWPHYYDSLRLFTPAWLNALPGLPFPGEPRRYPFRDEVVDYLRRYANGLECEIRTGAHVTSVSAADGGHLATTADGSQHWGKVLVAATGSFVRPHWPELPLDDYTGQVVHAADYRTPTPFAGQRVVVVGAGNSAAQIAVELAEYADVSLATRAPVRYLNTKPLRPDSWLWPVLGAASRVPLRSLSRGGTGTVPVLETGGYRAAIEERGRPDRRDMLWPDGQKQRVDAIILATGYRPALDYLSTSGVLDGNGRPRHRFGVATGCPGIGFVGLEYQRTVLSGSLGGVGRDARYVATKIA